MALEKIDLQQGGQNLALLHSLNQCNSAVQQVSGVLQNNLHSVFL